MRRYLLTVIVLVVAVAAAAPAALRAASTAPTVTTGSPTSVTTSSAGLTGTVNPNGTATTYTFDYGTTGAYGSQTAVVSAGSGTSATPVGATISGLVSGMTYHYRLTATSSAGTTDGPDVAFVTGKVPPAATTGSATVSGTSATLTASVNPNGKATTYLFQYGATGRYGLQTKTTSAGSGAAAVAVKATVGGLVPGMAYHFRVSATNSDGTVTGADATFAVGAVAPAASTGGAPFVTSSSAVVSGTVNPGGASATYVFQYGTSTAYGQQTAPVSAGAGTSSVHAGATITGLAQGTLYHYRVVATSAQGTTSGADASLITTGNPPVAGAPQPAVFDGGAAAITDHSAQLNGALNPPAQRTTWYFEYGLTTGYGVQTTAQTTLGQGARPVNVRLDGLQAGATFHFRLLAQTSSATYVGPDLTFTTKHTPRLRAKGLSVTASATASRSRVAVAVYGSLQPPTAALGANDCTGIVEVAVQRGPDTISLRSAQLRADCSYRESLVFAATRLRGARHLVIRVHFTGNAALLPIAARTVSVAT